MSNAPLDKYDTARLLDERIAVLCTTLADKLHAQYPHSSTDTFTLGDHKPGTRFVHIVSANADGSHRSVHAFVDTTTGDLIKAAGWKAPAKRKNGWATVGSLLVDADYERIIETCDWSGRYLYAR